MYNDSMPAPCYDGINCPDYCGDIDECNLHQYDCPMGRLCVNTWGSYKCECAQGLRAVENGCEGFYNVQFFFYLSVQTLTSVVEVIIIRTAT